MTKVIKILGRTIGVFLEWGLIIIILFAFLIRTSSFQSYLAKKATDFLSKEWKTVVSIGKVDITLFNRVYLENVSVRDLNGKQLLSIHSLEVLVQSFGSHHLDIQDVLLNEGSVWVYAQKPDGKMNFQFIADYFASPDTTTTSSKFTVSLSSISLKKTALRYDDFRVAPSKYGLDFNHIKLKQVDAKVAQLINDGPLTSLSLLSFSTKDKSGLCIKALDGKLKIDSHGLKVSNLNVTLNRSELHAKEIGYTYSNPTDLDDFNNKVHFNIVIEPSKVSLADVAYFAPALKGMNEVVILSGTLYNVINHFKIKDLDLRIKNKTHLLANLELPDFSDFSAYRFKEHIKNAQLDLQELSTIKLPGGKTLSLGPEAERLGVVSFSNMRINGIHGKLQLSPVKIATSKGNLHIKSTLQFDVLNENIAIKNLQPDSVALRLEQFELGGILANSELGVIDGNMKFSGFELLENGYRLSGGSGLMNRIGVHGYEYHQTTLKSFSIEGQTLTAHLAIDEPNVKINIEGDFNLAGAPTYNATINAEEINLDKLGFTDVKNTQVKGDFSFNTSGKSFDEFAGNVKVNKLVYAEGKQAIAIPNATLTFNHAMEEESLILRSPLADLDFTGKIDPNTISDDILFEISRVLPNLVNVVKPKKGKISNEIDATIKVKNLDEVTAMFIPELKVASGTNVVLKYNDLEDVLGLSLTSDEIVYDSIKIDGINFQQRVNSSGVTANLLLDKLDVGDSIVFNQVNFLTTGNVGVLNSSLGWDKDRLNDSRISWQTKMLSSTDFDLTFDQSRFSINGYKWYIENGSDILVKEHLIQTNEFKLKSDKKNQYIEAKGVLTDNKEDELRLQITNLDLEDLSNMLNLGVDLAGKVGGSVGLSNPFDALTLTSNMDVTSFFINKEEVGNFHLDANYNANLSVVDLKGNLAYRGIKTLDFSGNYLTEAKENNLTLRLDFNNADISFTNAFMDPDVIDKIQGKLNGFIDVKGTPDQPKLAGTLALKEASAVFTLLGCTYTLNGKIKVEEDGFLINKLPIKDQDGNVATLDGTVYHSNFSKFNYNIDLDFEEDYHHMNRDNPSGKIEKFMLLNTTYKEGDIYYGKAYGRGTANIYGAGSVMDVTVNVQTRKGTKLVFPMYGTSELEEESIIHFVPKGAKTAVVEEKIDFTGVNLDLSFDITPDAEVRLVFNEQTQDEIKAKTEGKLNMTLDAFNQMRLEGGLNVLGGSVYNFTMGPARKPFEIIDGSINWSGDVYKADMHIVTSYIVRNANMLELTPEQDDKVLSKQDAQCLLNLSGTLLKPIIGFELAAPKAPESGKALMNRINEDKDELNRQFFSLMLLGKFQPLRGTSSANESAALDLFENQINQALSQLSKSYNVKMDLGTNNVSTSVQKSILDDRLVITGNFGVSNGTEASATGGLIGDVSVEYLVNESGTFRVNAFNRSNSNTVKENIGPFTQGAGLSYHEDFNSRKDFVLLQSFLDVFRAKENKIVKFKRKKRQTKLPPVGEPSEPIQSTDKKEENE